MQVIAVAAVLVSKPGFWRAGSGLRQRRPKCAMWARATIPCTPRIRAAEPVPTRRRQPRMAGRAERACGNALGASRVSVL
jgi:hypothetical protein